MRERLDRCRGSVQIDSKGDGGTCVLARILMGPETPKGGTS
jgi:hypothetical protein